MQYHFDPKLVAAQQPDRTQFIKEFLEDNHAVPMIIAPPGTGKTLMLKTIEAFCSNAAVDFDHCAIANTRIHGQIAMAHKGKYSVIYLSLSGFTATTLELIKPQFYKKISELYLQHKDAIYRHLDKDQKKRFDAIVDGTASEYHYIDAIKTLSDYLDQYCNFPVLILIDDYDAPFYVASLNDKVIDFFTLVFLSALKGNNYCEKGCMAGITHIRLSGMLSGFNNTTPNDVVYEPSIYGPYFILKEADLNSLASKEHIDINQLRRIIAEDFSALSVSTALQFLKAYQALVTCVAKEKNAPLSIFNQSRQNAFNRMYNSLQEMDAEKVTYTVGLNRILNDALEIGDNNIISKVNACTSITNFMVNCTAMKPVS